MGRAVADELDIAHRKGLVADGFSIDLKSIGDQTLFVGDIQLIGNSTTQSLQLRLPGRPAWLLCQKLSKPLRDAIAQKSDPVVLWWSGSRLELPAVGLGGAIAYGKQINPELEAQIRKMRTPVFEISQDGAVQWQGDRGFSKTGVRILRICASSSGLICFP